MKPLTVNHFSKNERTGQTRIDIIINISEATFSYGSSAWYGMVGKTKGIFPGLWVVLPTYSSHFLLLECKKHR